MTAAEAVQRIREWACYAQGEKYGELAMRLGKILETVNSVEEWTP